MSADTAKSAPSPTDLKESESEYLADQASEAQAAIARTLGDLKAEFTHIVQNVSPIELTRRRPWISLGATAVAGFVAAIAIVPSKEQQAINRLAKIEAALRPPPPAPAEHNGKHADAKPPVGWLHTIMQELVKSLGPMLGTLVANLTAPAPAPDANPTASPTAKPPGSAA